MIPVHVSPNWHLAWSTVIFQNIRIPFLLTILILDLKKSTQLPGVVCKNDS